MIATGSGVSIGKCPGLVSINQRGKNFQFVARFGSPLRTHQKSNARQRRLVLRFISNWLDPHNAPCQTSLALRQSGRTPCEFRAIPQDYAMVIIDAITRRNSLPLMLKTTRLAETMLAALVCCSIRRFLPFDARTICETGIKLLFHDLLKPVLHSIADKAVQGAPRNDSHFPVYIAPTLGAQTIPDQTPDDLPHLRQMPYTPGMKILRRILRLFWPGFLRSLRGCRRRRGDLERRRERGRAPMLLRRVGRWASGSIRSWPTRN